MTLKKKKIGAILIICKTPPQVKLKSTQEDFICIHSNESNITEATHNPTPPQSDLHFRSLLPSSSSMASSSSTPNPASRWNHEVFLSFRGEDTRKNFTDQLYNALVRKGVHTFRDDDELRRGEDIASELVRAIDGSRIAVIVFSENYADSRWCLNELVQIMECREKYGQLVVPVFYKVDPMDVQNQTGSYGKPFKIHEVRFAGEMEKVRRWREVLTESVSLSGFRSTDFSAGYFTSSPSDLVCLI